jgi:ribonuclease E
MVKRMLIDAAHPEETRVVVLNGNKLEEFDFETSTKKQIKGNIYLAKVTRVEPSLQAAFVEYGGNRHGFLAFTEIHPDYYRIPVADRLAALEAERAAEQAANAREEARESRQTHVTEDEPNPPDSEPQAMDESPEENDEDEAGQAEDAGHAALAAPPETLREPEPLPLDDDADEDDEPAVDLGTPDPRDALGGAFAESALGEPDAAAEPPGLSPLPEPGEEALPDQAAAMTVAEAPNHERLGDVAAHHAGAIETVGGDELEETARPRTRPYRHYKIQEVIKRRQIMLVQVVKEERGNKGAALTTYLSLAGRYCVLMPNTPRGGGVSRKITSSTDRRRLKDMMSDLDLPEGMGVIVRTAGSERSKAEIKRDFEYLLSLWDEIRDLTLKSTAPALIYEEGNLIKRSIRDLYTRDIDEIVIDGDEGYKTAKTFMKMLMPSHAKRVKLYRDPGVPLLHRYQIEQQIDAIHSPLVQLPSGGYIVINPTEALVAIDVNSGRSTRERNIEETALKTNCEAAEEIARQLRLRDLAGLIVIDFIDMEEHRNRTQVERRLKEAMRHDRARIQLGRISPFGLLELSRQRLRPSLVEASTMPCPYCNGTGHIRSIESTALHVLRAIEEEGMRRRSAEIAVTVPPKVALYVLNQKRAALQQIEARFGIHVSFDNDESLVPPAFRLERIRALTPAELAALPSAAPPPPEPEEEDEDILADEEALPPPARPQGLPTDLITERASLDESEAHEERAPRERSNGHEARDDGRRRRRRRRGRRDERGDDARQAERRSKPPREPLEHEETAAVESQDEGAAPRETPQGDDAERRHRRRGRRGGRRRRRDGPRPDDGAALHAQHPQAFADAEPFEPAHSEDRPETETIELVPPDRLHNEPADEVGAFAAPPASGLDPGSVPVADGDTAPEPDTGASEQRPATHNVPTPHEVTGRTANPRRGWWRR